MCVRACMHIFVWAEGKGGGELLLCFWGVLIYVNVCILDLDRYVSDVSGDNFVCLLDVELFCMS